jgi:hypothetical protein
MSSAVFYFLMVLVCISSAENKRVFKCEYLTEYLMTNVREEMYPFCYNGIQPINDEY